jgi:hypothetical protein
MYTKLLQASTSSTDGFALLTRRIRIRITVDAFALLTTAGIAFALLTRRIRITNYCRHQRVRRDGFALLPLGPCRKPPAVGLPYLQLRPVGGSEIPPFKLRVVGPRIQIRRFQVRWAPPADAFNY